MERNDGTKGGGRFDGGSPPSGMEFAGIGIQLAAAILIFLYAGKWLDARLGTAPLLLIVGVFVGFGAGFYSVYRKLMRGPRP